MVCSLLEWSPVRVISTVVALLLTSCVGTAVPQPPNLDPVDPGLVRGPQGPDGPVELIGAPGSAAPNANLFVWDLDESTAPTVGPIAADGSFDFFVPLPAARLRMQARLGMARSVPVDLTPGGERATLLPRLDCVTVAQEAFVDATGQAQLGIDNTCESPVSLDEARWRVGGRFTTALPAERNLEAGARVELVIQATELATDAEDILLLTISAEGREGPVPYLYPTTVSPAPL